MQHIRFTTCRTSLPFLLLLCTTFLAAGRLQATEDTTSINYPSLSINAPEVEGFVPITWHLLDSTEGDLNNDGIRDLAFVVEGDTVMKEGRNSIDGSFTIDNRPRILGIAFGQPDGSYRLSLQSHRFVLRSSQGGVKGDPWAGIDIQNGDLIVHFYGGSTWQWRLDYRFSFRDDDWYLVSASSSDYDPKSGMINVADFDFVDQSASLLKGTIDPDNCVPCEDCSRCQSCPACGPCQECARIQEKIEKRPISSPELKRLSEFEPNNWEVLPGKLI